MTYSRAFIGFQPTHHGHRSSISFHGQANKQPATRIQRRGLYDQMLIVLSSYDFSEMTRVTTKVTADLNVLVSAKSSGKLVAFILHQHH